jgi:uncharacterized protein
MGEKTFSLLAERSHMSENLNLQQGSCDYCGHPLDPRVYFCPGCSKPYCPVELMLTPSAPVFENIETNLRTKAPEIWTVFFSFLSALVVTSFLGMAIWGTEDDEPTMLLVSFVLFVATAICAIRYWQDLKPLLKAPGIFKIAAWLGLVALAPMLLLNYGYHSFLIDLLDIEVDDYDEYFTSTYGALVFICIMPAIVEEVAFRGIIQHRLEKVVSPWIAMGAASILFSSAHLNLLSAPYLALVGMLLGWMKWKTGSLYPPMIAHFVHNYIVITYFPN